MEIKHPANPIHSWRDFFIHMGTVGAGLVLALGFEQAVNAVRHHHQVSELRGALRQDAANAIEQTLKLDDLESQQITRFTTMGDEIRHAAIRNQPVAPPPPPSHGDYDMPEDPAWQAAKTSGVATLLAPEEVQAYAEVSITIQHLFEAWLSRYECDRRLNAALAQFHTDFNSPKTGEYSTATPEELRQLALLFYEDANARIRLRRMGRELRGAERAIQQGKRSLPEILVAERDFLK
jgi:hypothetical protein